MSVTVTAIKWKYNQKQDKSYPIKIRVTYKTESKYYPVNYKGSSLSLTSENWEEINTKEKVSSELRRIRDQIRKSETEARSLCEYITMNGKRPFSFGKFDREHKGQSPASFLAIFDSYLQSLLMEGRIGTYRSYQCARVAFHKFLGKDIQIDELSPDLLKQFESFMIADKSNGDKSKKGVNKNTVAIYMRTLKVIYNFAATDNPHLLEHYPFARKRNEKNRYHIRTAAGKKGQALSLEELRKFLKTDATPGSGEWEAKQLWLFSFYCQGMNFRDICLLKVKNCDSGQITYIRNKTKNTELHDSPISVPITDSVKEIIKSISTGRNQEDFLFGFLSPDMTPLEVEKTVMTKIKVTNARLNAICTRNGLEPITTYWARHSYASLLKNSGVAVDVIRELLGHSSVRTTQVYLKNLETSKTTKINKDLQDLVHQTAIVSTN